MNKIEKKTEKIFKIALIAKKNSIEECHLHFFHPYGSADVHIFYCQGGGSPLAAASWEVEGLFAHAHVT